MADDAQPKEPINVYQVLMVMMEQLSSIAWQKLGLQPDVMTGTISPDLPQAKAAIDGAGELAKLFDHQLDEMDRRNLNTLLRDLRINYVEKTKEAQG